MPLVIPYLDLKKIHGEFCYFINISTSIYLGLGVVVYLVYMIIKS